MVSVQIGDAMNVAMSTPSRNSFRQGWALALRTDARLRAEALAPACPAISKHVIQVPEKISTLGSGHL